MKFRDDKFRAFLSQLKRDDNALLIEAIETGLSLIEGYADLASPVGEMSTLERYNQKASDMAASFGNESLHFLRASAQRMNPRYRRDPDEGEYEMTPTNDMNASTHRTQSVNGYEMHTGARKLDIPEAVLGEKDEITDSLGLTFDEMFK